MFSKDSNSPSPNLTIKWFIWWDLNIYLNCAAQENIYQPESGCRYPNVYICKSSTFSPHERSKVSKYAKSQNIVKVSGWLILGRCNTITMENLANYLVQSWENHLLGTQVHIWSQSWFLLWGYSQVSDWIFLVLRIYGIILNNTHALNCQKCHWGKITSKAT